METEGCCRETRQNRRRVAPEEDGRKQDDKRQLEQIENGRMQLHRREIVTKVPIEVRDFGKKQPPFAGLQKNVFFLETRARRARLPGQTKVDTLPKRVRWRIPPKRFTESSDKMG